MKRIKLNPNVIKASTMANIIKDKLSAPNNKTAVREGIDLVGIVEKVVAKKFAPDPAPEEKPE